MQTNTLAIFRRELSSYFRTPVAYVFLVIFLLSSIGSTFFLGNFYESGQADLNAFFRFLPWLYLVLVPAVGMRLWAEERRSGTIELLFTLPVSLAEAVMAKFFAAWCFLGLALALSFTLVLSVEYLGSPDYGIMLSSYMASFLLSGTYLAVSSLTSALTKNQVIAFILSIILNFILILIGWGFFTDLLSVVLPIPAVDLIATLGYMPHFQTMMKGILDSRDLAYFILIISGVLLLNVYVLQEKKSQ